MGAITRRNQDILLARELTGDLKEGHLWHHPVGQKQGYQDKAFHSAKVNTTAPARVQKQGLPLASG